MINYIFVLSVAINGMLTTSFDVSQNDFPNQIVQVSKKSNTSEPDQKNFDEAMALITTLFSVSADKPQDDSPQPLILETAIGPSQEVQDFESESLEMGVEHSQTVKEVPISSDYGSKDCASWTTPIANSRIIYTTFVEAEKTADKVDAVSIQPVSCKGDIIKYLTHCHDICKPFASPTVISDLEKEEDRPAEETCKCPPISEPSCDSCTICCDPRIYFDHVEGNWLDNRKGYTSFGMFIPFQLCTESYWFPFIDLRGHWFNNGKTAGNLGGGLRFINSDSSKVFGVNAYYDFRQGSWRHYYDQLGIGIEMLTPGWDFRCNSYFPLGGRKAHRRHEIDLGNGFEATNHQHQQSLGGFDAEIGKWLRRQSSCCRFNLYGALGFYSYFPEKHRRNILGGEVRIYSQLGRYVSIEIQGGCDRVNHGMLQGTLAITIPIGSCRCEVESCDQCCSGLLYQPVHRQEIIALDKKDKNWTWNWEDSFSCSDCNR